MPLDHFPPKDAIRFDLRGAGLPPWVEELFRQEAGSLEALLDCDLEVGPAIDGEPRWTVEPRAEGDPVAIAWDPEGQTLTSFAIGAREVLDSTGLLARLVRGTCDRVEWRAPQTVDEAVDVVVDVLGNDAAYWQLSAEDWPTVRDRALERRPATWPQFERWAEELVAQLPDGHARVADTTVPSFHPPYRGRLEGDAVVLHSVPEDSAAHAAGVRPGWSIAVDDAEQWWSTTPASTQGRPWRAARRFLRVFGEQRSFTAVAPGGRTATWTETRTDARELDPITVSRTRSGAVLVRLEWFPDDPRIAEVMDEVCREAGPDDHLVLDLRSNPGGKIYVAHRLLRRFLRERTLVGYTAFSNGRGGMGPRTARWAEPSDEARWPGGLTILVDVHTFSAAEDFASSLQGLPHVTVLGDVTGGAIGMPGKAPIGHGLEVWFACAIRYDRDGNPVDVRGIHPDGPLRVEAQAL